MSWLPGQIIHVAERILLNLKAREMAEDTSERTILWQILVSLANVEEACDDAETAESLHNQAREVVRYIVEHAGELRETFLAQPKVHSLQNK